MTHELRSYTRASWLLLGLCAVCGRGSGCCYLSLIPVAERSVTAVSRSTLDRPVTAPPPSGNAGSTRLRSRALWVRRVNLTPRSCAPALLRLPNGAPHLTGCIRTRRGARQSGHRLFAPCWTAASHTRQTAWLQCQRHGGARAPSRGWGHGLVYSSQQTEHSSAVHDGCNGAVGVAEAHEAGKLPQNRAVHRNRREQQPTRQTGASGACHSRQPTPGRGRCIYLIIIPAVRIYA